MNENYFKNNKNGVFVEIGAYDGISLSNTYFFEKELNWTGICIEPLPKVFSDLKKNRNCICLNCCVSDTNSLVQFAEVSGTPILLSGILKFYHPIHLERLKNECKRDGGTYRIKTMRSELLNDVLSRYNLFIIDYLSLDTEGGEFEILKTIDYEKFHINCISVENNYSNSEIKKFLESKNFKYICLLGYQDEIYINNNFNFSFNKK